MLRIVRTLRSTSLAPSASTVIVSSIRKSADGVFVSLTVVGEAGVGRTRLLAELAERASQDGDIVVGAGPHDSAAPVAYHPIRLLVQSLLDGDDASISLLAEREARDLPLVAAGLRELITPTGVVGAAHESKVGAVAAALAYVAQKAQARSGGRLHSRQMRASVPPTGPPWRAANGTARLSISHCVRS